VEVTIVQRGDQLLPREDRDVAEFLERRLINEGVRIIKNAHARSVATSDAGKVALQFLDRQSGRLANRLSLQTRSSSPSGEHQIFGIWI
jgi:pyruvate/2-oxoglutarate dehydrogenase complex dihydrolipoamide dehydrogenase (E3) component